MRNHNRRSEPTPELPGPRPMHLDEDLTKWILEDAAFHTYIVDGDYRTCTTCGRGVGFAETAAHVDNARPGLYLICWHCLVGILLYRGDLDPRSDRFPSRMLNSLALLGMAEARE